jgi:hypothetical protein
MRRFHSGNTDISVRFGMYRLRQDGYGISRPKMAGVINVSYCFCCFCHGHAVRYWLSILYSDVRRRETRETQCIEHWISSAFLQWPEVDTRLVCRIEFNIHMIAEDINSYSAYLGKLMSSAIIWILNSILHTRRVSTSGHWRILAILACCVQGMSEGIYLTYV